jgi:8-oxo-dGTP pyrophosphatase MutT (NUDIX family)
LVEHRKFGVWLYPGGRVMPNETPDEAVRREIIEETGLDTTPLAPLDHGLSDVDSDVTALALPYAVLCERIASTEAPRYHVDLIYLRRPVWGPERDLRPEPAEVLDARFVSAGETRALNMFPNFRKLLAKLFDDESVWTMVSPRPPRS